MELNYFALTEWDFKELAHRQAILDERFKDKETIRKATADRIKIAYITEVGELAQELKSEWCYWKNTAKQYDKRRVLEELSDCLHFFLSYLNNAEMPNREYEIKIDVVQKGIDEQSNTELTKEDFEKVTIEELLTIISMSSLSFGYNYTSMAKGVIISMMSLLVKLGVTHQEFLQVHHEVWCRNMNIRTQESY